MSSAGDDSLRSDLPVEVRSVIAGHRLSRRLDAWAIGCAALERTVRAWIAGSALRRSVLVVDDDPLVLAALVAVLSPIGCPVHAVTLDADAAAVIAMQGAAVTVHVVDQWSDAAATWRETRSSVIVTDLYLGDGETGLDLLVAVGRGPRSVVVTSHPHARESLDRAAVLAQAIGVVRTDTGHWQDCLRAHVVQLLAETDKGDPSDA